MTSPARDIALGLILSCLVTWTSSETQHPGKCPTSLKLFDNIGFLFLTCESKDECKEDEICCALNDEKLCVLGLKDNEKNDRAIRVRNDVADQIVKGFFEGTEDNCISFQDHDDKTVTIKLCNSTNIAAKPRKIPSKPRKIPPKPRKI